MARHRQRARDRKLGQPLHRENISGELDHVSAEVEEVEASIVAGAEGEPEPFAEEPPAGSGARRGAGAVALGPRADGDRAAAPGEAGVGRAIAFLRACWAELQRVQWPDRRQVAQATAVVIGFVAVAGIWLGVADVVAKHIVDAIL